MDIGVKSNQGAFLSQDTEGGLVGYAVLQHTKPIQLISYYKHHSLIYENNRKKLIYQEFFAMR